MALKYVRTAMFSNRIERFCTSEVPGVRKNHGDMFWRYQKDTVLSIQKRLKTGKKNCYEELFFVWSLRFSVPNVNE